MSFHGGLIGVAIAAWWFTRQKHVNEEQYAKLAAKARRRKSAGRRSASTRASATTNGS
jgi:hypothetical protein